MSPTRTDEALPSAEATFESYRHEVETHPQAGPLLTWYRPQGLTLITLQIPEGLSGAQALDAGIRAAKIATGGPALWATYCSEAWGRIRTEEQLAVHRPGDNARALKAGATDVIECVILHGIQAGGWGWAARRAFIRTAPGKVTWDAEPLHVENLDGVIGDVIDVIRTAVQP